MYTLVTIFFKLNLEVKVTVTWKQNVTLRDVSTHQIWFLPKIILDIIAQDMIFQELGQRSRSLCE